MGKLNRTTAEIAAKLAPIKHKSMTIQVVEWQGTASPYTVQVNDSDIVDGCRVDACVTIATQDIADEAGIYSDLQPSVWKFILSAKNKPTATIVFKYTIQL